MKPKQTTIEGAVKTVKKERKATIKEPTPRLVSFTMKAVIPTMQYGNLQPEITVEADTIDKASAMVLPYFTWMYENFSESTPKFVLKAKVAETKIVSENPSPATNNVEIQPQSANLEVVNHATEAFMKAKNAVDSAMSIDATNIIEDKIKVSTKLTEEEKQVLSAEVLKKRKELNG